MFATHKESNFCSILNYFFYGSGIECSIYIKPSVLKSVLLVNPRKHRDTSFIGREGKEKLIHDGDHFDHFERFHMKGD